MRPQGLWDDELHGASGFDQQARMLTALQRLIAHAGRDVILDHWSGDAKEIDDLSIRRALGAAAFFLPRRMRVRLRRLAVGH